MARNISTATENVTLATVDFFCGDGKFVAWDTGHVQEIAEYFAAWWHLNASDPRAQFAAASLWRNESREVQEAVDMAVREAELVLSGVWKREESPCAMNTASWRVGKSGYLEDGSGALVSGIGWNQNDYKASVSNKTWSWLRQGFAEVYAAFPSLFHNNDSITPSLRAAFGEDVATTAERGLPMVFYGLGAFPEWVVKKYPGINDFPQNFVDFDIDNPATRPLLAVLLNFTASVALTTAGTEHVGFSLANEPGFWKPNNSEYTYAKYRSFLNTTYSNNITSLNSLWGTNYASFDSIPSAPSPLPTLPAPPPLNWTSSYAHTAAQFFDWQSFNAERGSEFFEFMRDTILSTHSSLPASSAPLVFLKLVNRRIFVVPFDEHHPVDGIACGIDRVRLIRGMNLSVIDSRIAPAWADATDPEIPHPTYNASLYLLDWLAVGLGYTLARSVAPLKPIIDTELHYVSTVNWRSNFLNTPLNSTAYIQSALFFGFSHGLAGSEVWYWGREGSEGSPHPGDPASSTATYFPFSLLSNPTAFDAYHRTTPIFTQPSTISAFAALNALEPRPIQLLFSRTAQAMDTASAFSLANIGEALEFATSTYHWGFVVEDTFLQHPNTPQTLVIPSLTHISPQLLSSLSQRAQNTSLTTIFLANCSNPLHPSCPLFAYDSHGVPHPPEARAFLNVSTTTFLPIPPTTPLLTTSLAPLLPTFPFTCGANQKPTEFGVVCRYSPLTSTIILQNLTPHPITLNLQLHGEPVACVKSLVTGVEWKGVVGAGEWVIGKRCVGG